MKKIKKIIFRILTGILAIVLVCNIYNFINIKVFHKELATINGYSVLEVVSGSMEPTIHVGDMIIIDTKAKNYKANDIITFRDKEGFFVTHRIVSLNGNTMITKGDNNDSEDAPYSTDNIIGKYVTKISGAGRVLSSFKSPFTLIMIFIIGVLSCILLSTNEDGNPILDSDELEFQEFLKRKEEIMKKESGKVSNKKGIFMEALKKKISKLVIKKDSKEEKNTANKKTIVKKKIDEPKMAVKKEASSKKTNSKTTNKKVETKKEVSSKKTTNTNSKVKSTKTVTKNSKATTPKKEVSKGTVNKDTKEEKKDANKNKTAKKAINKPKVAVKKEGSSKKITASNSKTKSTKAGTKNSKTSASKKEVKKTNKK